MNHQLQSPAASFRRNAVRLLLLVWMVVLVAPCVHCLPIAAGLTAAAPVAPVAPVPATDAAGEMPADCPMHAKAAQHAGTEEPPAAPASGPDCPKPTDCCLTQGAAPVAVPEGVQAPPSPWVAIAELPPLVAAPLPAPFFLPRELGDQRSHAPPSFLTPLRI